MTKYCLFTLSLCLCLGCSSKDKSQKAPTTTQTTTNNKPIEPYYTVDGDSLVIPPFEIEVKLSDKAAQKLKKDKETVIVAAYFSGIPIDAKAADEIGQISVVNKLIELKDGNTLARFEGLKFSKKLYDSLAEKDITLLINIFSGRKSTDDNLLDGGLLDKKASNLTDKRFIMPCYLIDEAAAMDKTTPSVVECFAPPKMPNQPIQKPKLLVKCSETGQMTFADSTLKDMDAFKTEMRSVLTALQKMGTKTEDLPDIETQGCMMGMSGELRTVFQEIKNDLGKTTTPKPTVTKPKVTPKPVTTAAVSIVVNKKGDIFLAGKQVALESLKKELQNILVKKMVILNQIPVQFDKNLLMGMRGAVNDEVNAAIAGAKWLKKKAALDNALITIVVNKQGDIFLSGKKVSLESLKKELQNALVKKTIIPDQIPVQFDKNLLMGTRGTVNDEVNAAIGGAKWLKKKAALEVAKPK